MIRPFITAAALLFSLSSHAVTVTFDDIGDALVSGEYGYPAPPYTEAGITFSAPSGDFGHYFNPGTIHVDDSGTSITDTVIVTTGSVFTPESMTFDGEDVVFMYDMIDPNDPDEQWIEGITLVEGVLIRGFRGNKLVAEDRFSATAQPSYVFSSAFAKIDALEIVADVDRDAVIAMIVAQHPEYVVLVDTIRCQPEAPCSHFNIDSISINTSPKKGKCPRVKKPKKP